MTISSWPSSEAAWQRTKRSLSGGVSTGLRASMKPHPIFFEGGKGARLVDIDGNSYLDYVLGWGPVILGHGHPGLTAAVSEQLPLGATYGSGHMLEAIAAEAVLERIPHAERILWSNTGSEATQVALRLARAYTGRRRFIKFRGHYHGWSDTFLLAYRPDSSGDLGLGTRGQNPDALADAELVDWGDLNHVREALEAPDNDIAAVFLEPVMVNSGAFMPPEGFLEGLREICDRTGTLLIFDEVITGFRIAAGGAVERFGVVPDLVVLAKAIAGGYPLASIAGKAKIIDQVTQGVVHAGTYNGNPVVLAAAVATLEALGQPGIYESFERQGLRLAQGLADVFSEQELPLTVNHIGPIVQCIPSSNVSDFEGFLQADQSFYDRFIVEMLRRGQLLLPGGRWYISSAHSDSDIEETIAAAKASLAALR